MRIRIITIAILAAIGSLLIGVNDANAGGWGCYGVSSGCYGISAGCYGASAGCYGGVAVGCYGYSGCYGGHHVGLAQRRAARFHARHAAHGCYGSYYSGCYSSCYSGCYSSCYGSCYGSHGCYGPTVIYDSAPVQRGIEGAQPAPAPAPAASPAPAVPTPTEGAQLSRGTALLAVDVPAGAVIYVNGSKTKTEGRHRRYVSSGLISGRSYRYEVQAVVERGGRTRAITKSVTLTAGSEARVSFEFADAAPPAAVLTQHVHDQANVN